MTGRHHDRAWRASLDEAVQTLAPLSALRHRQQALHGALHDLDHAVSQAERGLVAVLVGSTGAGKSTLLNALAGQALATPGVLRPTTTTPVVFAPDDVSPTLLQGWQDDPRVGPLRISQYSTASSDPAGWAGQVFVDAPDVNSIAREHRDRVTALVERADVLIVVLHRQSIVEASPVEFLTEWAGRREIVVVLNRADELTPATAQSLTDQVRDLARTRWGLGEVTVFRTAAAQASVDPVGSGLHALSQHLRTFAQEAIVHGVRRRRVHGAARAVAVLGQEVSEAALADLQALPVDLRTALDQTKQTLLTDVQARLTARAADLQARLLDEVGRRWWGPVGVLVRVGGVSALGAGLGAVVASRSLVGGAVLAGASTALQQGGAHLREARLAHGGEIVPTPSDTLDALSPATTAVTARRRRLGLPGAPSAESLAEPLLAGMSDAWRAVLDRDLPALASRAANPWVGTLLDLPLLGAAGWIVYRVADGYLASQYEGMPFLVDTLILAAAWALIARGLGRLWVRRHRSAVEAAVLAAFDARLTRTTAQLVEGAYAETQPLLDAVQHLAHADHHSP